jgi:hypothetical protein
MTYLGRGGLGLQKMLEVGQEITFHGVLLVTLMESNQLFHIFGFEMTGQAFFFTFVGREELQKAGIQPR